MGAGLRVKIVRLPVTSRLCPARAGKSCHKSESQYEKSHVDRYSFDSEDREFSTQPSENTGDPLFEIARQGGIFRTSRATSDDETLPRDSRSSGPGREYRQFYLTLRSQVQACVRRLHLHADYQSPALDTRDSLHQSEIEHPDTSPGVIFPLAGFRSPV